MTTVYWLSGAALSVVAAVSCYTDSKFGKIPNWIIIFGLTYAVGLYVFLSAYNLVFAHNPANFTYVVKMAINGLTALLVGFLLWRFNFWSAGDAKLFAVYAAIIPLESYSGGAISQFLSFNLLVNLFFPLVLILGAKAFAFFSINLIKTIKQGIFSDVLARTLSKDLLLREVTGTVRGFLDFVFMYAIFSNLSILVSFISGGGVTLNSFVGYFCMLFFSGKINRLKERVRYVGLAIQSIAITYLLYFVLAGDFPALKRILVFSIFFMLSINLTRRALTYYVQKVEVKEVRVRELREGMVIHQDDLGAIKNMAEEAGGGEEFDSIRQGGIKEGHISAIKELFSGREETIFRVYNSFPFAPYLSFSAILTFATKASFLNLMADMMKLIQ